MRALLGFILLVSLCSESFASNDNFADRIPITTDTFVSEADLSEATLEPGEPAHHPNGSQRAAHWWTWTAPADGYFEIFIPGYSGSSPGIAVYTGNSLETLTPIFQTAGLHVPYRFTTAGETYQIAIFAGENNPSGTWAIWQFLFTRPPANDHFTDSTLMSGSDFTLSSTTQGASLESLEPTEGGNFGTNTIWFTWTAPHTGTATLTPFESQVTPLIVIYRGDSLQNLERHFAGDGWRDMFPTTAGVTYHFQISGYGSGGGKFNVRVTSSPLHIVSPPNGTEFKGIPNIPLIIDGLPPGATSWTVQNSAMTFRLELPASQTSASLEGLPPGIHHLSVSAVDSSGDIYNSAPIQVVRRPSNDSFETPDSEFDIEGRFVGDFRASSIVPAEPPTDPSALGTLWWAWTAPADGKLFLSETIGPFTYELFAGDSLEELALLPVEPNPFFTIWPVRAGVTYKLRSSRLDSSSESSVGRIQFAASAPNDHFADRILLTSPTNSFQVPIGIATVETGEPAPYSGSVWYEWIAPEKGRFIGTGQISLYKGDAVNALTHIAGPDFSVSTIVSPGDSLKIRITGGDDPFAIATVTTRFIPYPQNDIFANRTHLTGTSGTLAVNAEQATLENLEPPVQGPTFTRSIWYQWSVPAGGQILLNSPDARLDVYSGANLSSLDPLPIYDGIAHRFSAAQTFIIRLSGSTNDSGEFRFSYRFDPRPSNDNFSNATQLPSFSDLTWTATTRGATQEPGEPRPQGLPTDLPSFFTVWWKWTAPESGLTRLTLSEAAMPDVFSGSSLGSLTFHSNWTGTEEPWANAAFQSVAGQTYYIRVATLWAPYDAELRLTQPNRTRITSAQANGSIVSITGISEPNTSVVLYSSTNLLSWIPVKTNQLSGTNTFNITSRVWPNLSKEFFQVRRR